VKRILTNNELILFWGKKRMIKAVGYIEQRVSGKLIRNKIRLITKLKWQLGK